MERSLGRFLRDDEVVHHISENRRDNRLENLQVMTVSEHARWHMPKGEFIQIRIDAAEKARWQEAAEQAGGSLSEAIRLVMNEKLGTLSEPGASLVEHAPTGLQAVSPGPESVPAKKTYQPDFKK